MMNTNTLSPLSVSSLLDTSHPHVLPLPGHVARVEREHERIPFGGMIRLVYGDFHDFVVSCRGNISIGGMYLPTDAPLPKGEIFDFELMLGDQLTLVRGVGEVIRSQPPTDRDTLPGMAIRFVRLDPAGRDLIFRTVDRHIQAGGHPFSLENIDDRRGEREPGAWRRSSSASRSRLWGRVTKTIRSLIVS